jgi:hypothetical protein
MAGSENKPGIVYISRYVMIVSLLLFLTAASSFGQVSRATLPFLLMAPDARGRSMGEGGSVFATGAVAAFYNPASIVSVTTAAGEFNYFKPMPSWENNLYALNIYAAFALPNSLRFAVGMNRLDYGTFELIGPYGEILWRYEYYDFAISAYSAVDFDSLSSVGIGIKYIYSQAIADWTGGNLGLADGNILAADFGMLFRNRFRNLTYTSSNYTFPEIRKWARTRDNRGLSFGISVANLGPKVSYENSDRKDPLPINLRLAAGYQVIDTDILGFDITFDATKLLIDLNDSFKTELDEIVLSYGAEANILYLFNLRGGRYFDTIGRQRMWMIGWGIGPEWLHFDYSRTYDTEDNWPSKDGAYSLSLYCNLPSGILRWF